MDTKIIDGNAAAKAIRAELKVRVERLAARGKIPGLAVVLAGENPASRVYVRNKTRACAEIGVYSEQHDLPAESTETELLDRVRSLNADPRIHGILVQLPLPGHISPERVLNSIAPEKDADGFHPCNVG